MSSFEYKIQADILPLAPSWYQVRIPRSLYCGVDALSKQWRPGNLGMSTHQLQNVHAQSVPMQRLNKQSIIQIQRLTFKIVSMCSQQHSNVTLILCETVIGLGRDVPGCPAFIRISSWWSLMILCGWLISAHHLAIWALKFDKWLHSKYKWSTHLNSSVVWAQWDILMGGWPWWVNTANINSLHSSRLCLFECWLDKMLTKAPHCMTLEIGHGSTNCLTQHLRHLWYESIHQLWWNNNMVSKLPKVSHLYLLTAQWVVHYSYGQANMVSFLPAVQIFLSKNGPQKWIQQIKIHPKLPWKENYPFFVGMAKFWGSNSFI